MAKPKTIKPSYDKRFIQQFVGVNMMSNGRVAIIELIANAWDAGATKVEIIWPTESTDNHFYILDNGNGMTEQQFTGRYMRISYNRIAEQGYFVEFPQAAANAGKRTAFGKNGMGRLAAFCFADKYTVETAVDGKPTNAFHITQGTSAEPLVADPVNATHNFAPSGTKISTDEFHCRALEISDLRKEIGMRFLSDPHFQIFVNGVIIDLMDIPNLNVHKFFAELQGIPPIQIIAIDTARPDGSTNQHGVAWHVNGRLVGECSWKGPNGEKFLDGRKHVAKRFTFLVTADCLTDFVKPDWTGFKTEEPFYTSVFDAVNQAILKFIHEFFRGERTKVLNDIKHKNQAILKKLSPIELQNWEGFVEQTQENSNVSDDVLEDIAKILANLLMANSRYALLHKLGGYDVTQLDSLNDILTEWTVDMAKVVLDELSIRMLLIADLQAKSNNKLTDELKDLQPLFERGLWMFGPEYESIHFTSNKGITTILKTLFKIDDTGSKNRPDFVVLPSGDASIGAYSIPKFDENDGGEIGISKVVIVELKKPGIPIGSEQREQTLKYIKELKEKGAIEPQTIVMCYVLGSEIDPLEIDKFVQGNTTVQPMTYNTVVARANSRLLNLKKKVEDAPFLQENGLAEFVKRDKNIKAQTEFEV